MVAPILLSPPSISWVRGQVVALQLPRPHSNQLLRSNKPYMILGCNRPSGVTPNIQHLGVAEKTNQEN